MTLIPDEPAGLGCSGDSKTIIVVLKKMKLYCFPVRAKVEAFLVYLRGTILSRVYSVEDPSWRPGTGSEGNVQTHPELDRYLLARPFPGSDFCGMSSVE